VKTLFTEGERLGLREARQTKVFGNAMGLVVRKSSYPESFVRRGLDLREPFTGYTVSTPKPHDTFLGVVVKKGKQWHYAASPRYKTVARRGAMPALKGLVTRYITGVIDNELRMSDGTLDGAIEGLGCHILQRLAHEWGIVKEYER